jgi:polyhydroxybutyrate depolymerase
VTKLQVSCRAGPREALVEAPEQPERPLPLLLMFHGAGATAELARTNTGWGGFARQTGLIAVFPEGTRRNSSEPQSFRRNPQAWNDGSGRGHVARSGVDDVGFVSALIDAVADRWPVDRARIYATGFSNGASLVFRLATELADQLAAAAPVAGHLWLRDPRPARPVPLLLICGTADPLNPLDGGLVTTPWGRPEEHPPMGESARRWAKATGCSPEARATIEQPGVRTLSWSGTGAGGVRFTTVEGLGHAWPGGRRLLPEWIGGASSSLLDGTAAVWGFLSGHHL